MNEDDAVIMLNAIADRYYAEGDATRKPVSYLRAYHRLLGHRRDAKLRILEIGVSSGASLLIWRDYLSQATIVGVDIAEMPAHLADQDRIHFVRGSQDDPAVLDRAAGVAGGAFDMIVDDASHIGYLTKRSLDHLFPHWLVPGGYYVIEDIGTSFLREYPDGSAFIAPTRDDAVEGTVEFRSHQNGMVGVVKQLIDHMMQELSVGTQSYLPIQSITLETNIAFIEKLRRPEAMAAAPPTVAVPPEAAAGWVDVSRELTRQTERIDELERLVGRLLRPAPRLLSAWRKVTGQFTPPPSK
jgi:cephalosporin hydroxylase